MKKVTIFQVFVISLLLFLTSFQTVFALDPSIGVICCWEQEKNVELPEECSKVDLENCGEILKDWERAESAWLKKTTPIYLWPEFIYGSVGVLAATFLLLVWKFLKRKKT